MTPIQLLMAADEWLDEAAFFDAKRLSVPAARARTNAARYERDAARKLREHLGTCRGLWRGGR